MCVSGGKKCSFFGKFGMLYFLETPVLRFALLPYYRRITTFKQNTRWNFRFCKCIFWKIQGVLLNKSVMDEVRAARQAIEYSNSKGKRASNFGMMEIKADLPTLTHFASFTRSSPCNHSLTHILQNFTQFYNFCFTSFTILTDQISISPNTWCWQVCKS